MVTAQWCSFLIAMNLNNIQTCFHSFVSSRLGVDDSCSSNSSCHFSSVLFHLVSVCYHYVSLVLFPFMVSVPSPAEPLLLLLLQTQYIPFFSHFSCFHFANVCFFISFSQNSFHIIPDLLLTPCFCCLLLQDRTGLSSRTCWLTCGMLRTFPPCSRL